MPIAPSRPARLFLLAFALFNAGPACADAIPLAVRAGRCEFVVGPEHGGSPFYLVVGSLAPADRKTRVEVRVEPCDEPQQLPVEKTIPSAAWQENVNELARQQEQARREWRPPFVGAKASPPRTKTFHVFVGEKDLHNAAHYHAVEADLRAVGEHCQVYVDRDEQAPDLSATIDEVVRVFDRELVPWSRDHLGDAEDVDRDGRFTILLTPWLGKLQGGRVAVDGFVRGSDFFRDLAAPFSNRCDMMYLNSRLRPGPHLRTLLAHEYTHAVVFSEHVLRAQPASAHRQDEEGWLNEGLAHLVEARTAQSWTNLDYRISAYLSCPERYSLVVPDYFQAGLWRTAGTRGAAYLFVHACQERHDPDFLRRMVRSSLNGTRNLEAATQEPFADVFRRWSVAQLTDARPWKQEAGRPFERLCIGPRFHDVSAAAGTTKFDVAGTRVLYVRCLPDGPRPVRVTVRADAGDPVQLTLVKVPNRPHLRVAWQAGDTPNCGRLVVTARGDDVQLRAAAWERVTPTGRTADDTSFRPGDGPGWFGTPSLKAGRTVTSGEIVLPASVAGAELVFKVWAEDNAGRLVAGWASRPGRADLP